MRILIRGGRVIDPASGIDGKLDVLIDGRRIAEVGEDLSDLERGRDDVTVVDAVGKIVTPGLIDMHVHLREPGREDEETIRSGGRAAAKGGFTSVACMPNTTPAIDNQMGVEYIISKAKQESPVNVFPIGAITKNLAGEELSEIGTLQKAGAVAISDDGNCVMSAEVVRRSLEYARMFGIPLIEHCEDVSLTRDGVMNEGYFSTILGLRGMPSASEEIIVARDIILAELTGGHIHIAHVSSKGSVELIRAAKRKGIRVTCEATPHHLTLTDEALRSYNANFKMNPPLRSSRDVEGLREGLRDGTIDAIATDHAPHLEVEKEVELQYAPFGVIGLETAVPIIITYLVETGVISLNRAIELLTIGPARILNLKKGSLKVGSDADITIIDLRKELTITDNFESQCKNSPFIGHRLRGFPVVTIVGGRIVMREGVVYDSGEDRSD